VSSRRQCESIMFSSAGMCMRELRNSLRGGGWTSSVVSAREEEVLHRSGALMFRKVSNRSGGRKNRRIFLE
jgi:hypothetical protein